VNSELAASRCVIATGGSAIYRDYAMQKLKSMGKVVYLKHSLQTIEKRIGDVKKRGVAMKEGFTLKDLYEERAPLYEKYADITVSLKEEPLSKTVARVLKAIQ
jgi:shikimate kinase